MNYAILRAEIVNDPAGMGYAVHANAYADSLVADLVNLPQGEAVLGLCDIPTLQAELHKLMHATGLPVWVLIRKTAVSDQVPVELAACCQMVLDVAAAKYQNVDLSLPAVQAVLTGLVAGGVLTAEQKVQVESLGRRQRSRAEVLGLVEQGGKVSADEVSLALLPTR